MRNANNFSQTHIYDTTTNTYADGYQSTTRCPLDTANAASEFGKLRPCATCIQLLMAQTRRATIIDKYDSTASFIRRAQRLLSGTTTKPDIMQNRKAERYGADRFF